MIFHDLEALLEETGIVDKYILTRVISSRARDFCEKKSSSLDDLTSGRCINQAILDLEEGNINLIFSAEAPLTQQEGGGHGSLEE